MSKVSDDDLLFISGGGAAVGCALAVFDDLTWGKKMDENEKGGR